VPSADAVAFREVIEIDLSWIIDGQHANVRQGVCGGNPDCGGTVSGVHESGAPYMRRVHDDPLSTGWFCTGAAR
jgi:hypothetical protein